MLHVNEAGRIRIKRAYEDRSPEDGRRILVDRLWPRGVRKAELRDAVWMKEVAPSAALRKWFGHRPERWPEFRARYLRELSSNPAVEALRYLVASGGPVTLVYSARDPFHNQAVVLTEFLQADRPGQHTSSERGRAGRTSPPSGATRAVDLTSTSPAAPKPGRPTGARNPPTPSGTRP